MSRQKTVVVGAGPVGALAALYAAERGHDVEIYELRSDLRDPSTTPLNFTKSINLALSERGINAMRSSGRPEMLERILKETLPMTGRMVHGITASGDDTEQSQDYDVHGRAIYAVDRGGLNKALLDELEALPNVKFFFSHKLTGADFRNHKAWFEISGTKTSKSPAEARLREIEISFDFLIGADGAHSATRFHMMKFARMDYEQVYIDTLWCEFTIKPKKSRTPEDGESNFKISPNHLHIWPGKDKMFIAIPSLDSSFTCTLFAPAATFSSLEADPNSVLAFFHANFPGVPRLIPPHELKASFTENTHLPLISIKCKPHYFGDSVVIVGDAAHAMVPFYGQGMNAGLEDVRVLFSFLDEEAKLSPSKTPAEQRFAALAKYSAQRTSDTYAINDLALENYTEMRSSVVSRVYKTRKWLEEKISVWVPSLGWQTKYSRVSFGNERYSEIVKRSEKQGKLLLVGLAGLVATPLVVGSLGALYKLRNATKSTRGLWR